jgi:hypothetical protein
VNEIKFEFFIISLDRFEFGKSSKVHAKVKQLGPAVFPGAFPPT